MLFSITSLLLWTSIVVAQNTYIEGGIYQQIEAFGSMRLLNATGVTGPASPTTSGVVYQILNNDDLAAFLAFSPAFVKFAVVIPFALFTPSVMDTLRGSNKLAGVIVIQTYDEGFPVPPQYSPDAPFPNFQFSLYANSSKAPHAWNPNGNSMLYKSFDYPLFVMPVNPNDLSWQQSVGTLLETAKYNLNRGYQTYPLYAIEFNEFMYGSIDAATCLRRGWCSPVGASSVWGTFSYNISRKDTRNIVVVSAQSDSNGFFQDFVTSAATTASGYVTLLAVANALSQNQVAINSLPSDILFTLFSTEAFGFAGSQRFIQDISTPFKCITPPVDGNSTTNSCAYQGPFCANPCQVTAGFTNVDFDRISAVIELNQVSGAGLSSLSANPQIYVHVDDATDAGTQALVKLFTGSVAAGTGKKVGTPATAAASSLNVNFAAAFAGVGSNDGNLGLPPSSVMSFLAKKKIPAVVLGDYQTSFSNKFYNSIYDDASQIASDNIAVMCGVATQTARSVFQVAGGSATDAANFNANCTLVAELFDCFTANATCALFHSIYPAQKVPFSGNYPGTFQQQPFTSVPPFMMYSLLANYTAAKRAPNGCDSSSRNPTCGNDPNIICVANTCVTSQTNPHFAYGTGIEMDYSTGNYKIVDVKKGTWVQSQANGGNIRIRTFLTSSPQYQGMQIGVGLALTIVATVVTYYVQRIVDAKFK
ncbi:UNVERIFIED_CONTAM: hypothetical protein HDU68_008370 [Siphonaria sp. JEL0065]|nr:hypothetical protein HDU68_008370 [Siphonaria sp. JEL0065]